MKTPLKLPLSDYRKLSDEELVHRYANRREQVAFECLYERYAHLVIGMCNKYLNNIEAAKDATQQIFIKLLENLIKFEINNFKPWLYRVAKNYCLMQLRGSVPVINNVIGGNANMEFEDDLHPKLEQEKMLLKLEDALNNLNKEQKICIEHFYLQKMTYAEIASKTGYSLLQVKSNIQNGKRNLKLKLETKTGGVRP